MSLGLFKNPDADPAPAKTIAFTEPDIDTLPYSIF